MVILGLIVEDHESDNEDALRPGDNCHPGQDNGELAQPEKAQELMAATSSGPRRISCSRVKGTTDKPKQQEDFEDGYLNLAATSQCRGHWNTWRVVKIMLGTLVSFC